ncbi:MAG: ACT domain-containing protein [Candidatus Micrarchaeota archaeon]|nr:ACT domain-containing protein [Candidatus Micrarchaeota archaeon]
MAKPDELSLLLRTLSPEADEKKYFIGTFGESQMMGLAKHLAHIVCIYREKEGLTAVFSEEIADDLARYTEIKMVGPFALITLQAISPLLLVGLLAKLTTALSKEGIPVNAYSAYYHDHLLVPFEMKDNALAVLKKLEKS